MNVFEIFCLVSLVLVVMFVVMCLTVALSVGFLPLSPYIKTLLEVTYVKNRKVNVSGRIFQEEWTFLHH